jgi:hypothetical protein
MSNVIPSIDDFKQQIEVLVGRQLTVPATEAAEDFWKHWVSFSELISRRQLSLHVDPLFLAEHFPQHRRYNTWRGGGFLALLIGLGLVWFFWPIGSILIATGFGLYLYGNHIGSNTATTFAENIMKEATPNPASGGYAGLCANYIAGIIFIIIIILLVLYLTGNIHL